MTDLPIKIRGLSHPEVPLFDSEGTVTNQEKAFIASSWSHKERANPAYFWVSKRAFHYQFYLGVVCMLLDARPELFEVAYNTEKPDQILAWVCADDSDRPHRQIVHQHYIKEDFREYISEDFIKGTFSRQAKPKEFMELINDTRKAEAAKDSVPGIKERTRQANQEHPSSLSRTPVPQGS